MRYFAEGELDMATITKAMAEREPPMRVEDGLLWSADARLGEIDLCTAGDPLFAEELHEMLEEVEGSESPEAPTVALRLRRSKTTIALRVLWDGRETEPTFAAIDPLWELLEELSVGLLQADGEGFYEDGELVLATD